jgi:DNA-binding response OmpR family regulator
MATALILATDHLIGGLLGQLTELAGHSAQFRHAGEEASEAVRTMRPDIVLLDAAYGRTTLELAAEAAASVGAQVVYFASTLPAGELRRFALQQGARYFALPAGPKLLARVLADALAARGGGPEMTADVESTSRYAVAAAVAAVARARALAERSASIRAESRVLRAEREAALAECRRSQAELREAVIAYTRELRNAGVPPAQTLDLVKGVLRAEAGGQRGGTELAGDLDDAVEWCLQAYYAA